MIYYAFGLLALGMVFIMLEIFVPSLGLLSILAAVSIVGGGILAFLDDSSGVFVAYLLISFVMIPALLILALKVFPRTPIGKIFTLGGPSFDPKEAQAGEKGSRELVGIEGETLTPLHPSGIILAGERRIDVVTRGEMVERGVLVRIVKVEGNRIVVERSGAPTSPYT